MRTRGKIVLLVGAALLLLLAGGLVGYHYHLKNRLARFKAELVSKGEKLELSQMAPLWEIDTTNGAFALISLAQQLGNLEYQNVLPAMTMVAPGRARVTWMQTSIKARDVQSNCWPNTIAIVQTNAETFAEIQALAAAAQFRFHINYQDGFMALLPHLAPLKQLSQWHTTAALVALHSGNAPMAKDRLLTMVTLLDHWPSEGMMISHLVRIAMWQVTANALWEYLQSEKATEPDLATLQKKLETWPCLRDFDRAMECERAMMLSFYPKARESFAYIQQLTMGNNPANPFQTLAENPKEGLKEIGQTLMIKLYWVPFGSYSDEYLHLHILNVHLESSRALTLGRPMAEVLQREQTNHAATIHALGAPTLDDLIDLADGSAYPKFSLKAARSETLRQLLISAFALKRYHLAQHHWPGQLTDLVPTYLAAVPRDPMDGQPLRYRVETNGYYRLYSVGENGVDDGGSVTPKKGSSRFFWYDAPDWVLPQPASPAEVEAFEKTSN
jgi:hypothetical protein